MKKTNIFLTSSFLRLEAGGGLELRRQVLNGPGLMEPSGPLKIGVTRGKIVANNPVVMVTVWISVIII